jgi:hypothetical protein
MLIIEAPHTDLIGRIISLNLQNCKRFQCGGFSLSPARPFAVVEPSSQQASIRQGLLDGRLVDITDQNIKGMEIAGTAHSPAQVLDEKGKRVYLQVNVDGSLTVIAPKDEEEEILREAELASNGVLLVNESNVEISNISFDQRGRVDLTTAEQIITNMATTLEYARSKQPIDRKKVN